MKREAKSYFLLLFWSFVGQKSEGFAWHLAVMWYNHIVDQAESKFVTESKLRLGYPAV